MGSKEVLSEILSYYKYKVDNNLCTMEEMESAKKALEENMEIYGTIDDIADFYGKTPGNVRVAINRKMFAKPKRKVLYPFHEFIKIVSDKWRKDKKLGK